MNGETQIQKPPPRYVAVMPWPVKDLDEWNHRYVEVAPDADPNEAAWLERIAKIALDVDKDRSPPSNSPGSMTNQND